MSWWEFRGFWGILQRSQPINMWYNKLNISGTPQTKQDIKIEISYYVRGAVGWFESMDQKEFYQIKVKE